jgi:hypothetical protein
MTRARLALLALALGGCATTGSEAPLRISNVKQGLARVESPRSGTIYSEGTSFRVAKNGDCIAIGKRVPCMWYAIAFDYVATSEATTLACSTVFDEPTEVVDPSRSHGKDREFVGEITLRGTSGHAFWPGYVTIDDEKVPDRMTMTCRFDGKEVLRVGFAFAPG